MLRDNVMLLPFQLPLRHAYTIAVLNIRTNAVA